jgi:RNA polymerase sigma factor (sigma-70 family)
MDNIDINEKFASKWNDSNVSNIMNKVANRYRANIDVDEIESIKMNTLWKCIEKHDEDKSKFTSFLYSQLSFALKNKVKKKKLEYNCSTIEKEDFKAVVSMEYTDIVSGLPDDTRQILNQRFYQNLTMKEIGKINGYSRETARRRLKNAINLCKNACETM